MAQIKDILSIQLEDDIKSVINLNSQSEQDLKEELDGFILTESLAKHLSDFCDLYSSNTKQSGVWLSGFYGSGKSYFAKMVGMLLQNRTLVGTPMRERFIPKLNGLKDEAILQHHIDGLGRTSNHVVLFDAAKESNEHGISYMMMAAFLRSLGFHDNWVGMWEYDLYINGQYSEFLLQVQATSGVSWHEVRESQLKVIPAIKKALVVLGVDEDNYVETRELIKEHIRVYDANKLSADLNRYLKKESDKRIVFMVDEVSESIAQDKINILDIEGMAESLVEFGQRVWTIAIAQQRLDDVISKTNVNKDKLTKLVDRFKNRIDIKADEVETIIRHRLLAKTDEGSQQLKAYFEKNSGMLGDMTHIGATNLHKTTHAQTYVDYYPFFEHQFKMLQYFLFGTQNLVRTQVGTRGMLISAFDILRKESVKDYEVFTHVNAAQLCRQAEENVSESLNNRYLQADGLIHKPAYKQVSGHALLQTIHFLTKAGVIQTTAENIAKSVVSVPDEYYQIKAEVTKALEVLVENKILLYSSNQYRITSEIEQRILEDMNNYEVPGYRIKSEVVKTLKNQPLAKCASKCTVDGLPVDFSVKMNNDDPISTNQNSPLHIVMHDLFAVQKEPLSYIDMIKEETQSSKNTLSIIPAIEGADEIWKLAETLLRMNELEGKTYATNEEKAIQHAILSAKEEKLQQVTQLISQAYTSGTLVYCFNTAKLTDANYATTIGNAQQQLFGNIYTRRLSAVLVDSLAPKVLKMADTQLKNISPAPDFAFFDTAGRFMGEQLSVVTEIVALIKSYTSGVELEKKLSDAPTGYTFGTIVTTLAVLFRANKIIVKCGSSEYHSYSDKEAETVFSNSTQFRKASFKAIAKSLSYNERQEIVDILKEECNYTTWTKEIINYQMNDYELVDAIRSLSKEVLHRINDHIMGDNEMEQNFRMSVAARAVLQPYTPTVTDINYFGTAKQFLMEENTDEFVKAIEIVARDLKFIKEGLPQIRNERDFIAKVEEELDKSQCVKATFTPLKESFEQMLTTNLVANAQQMQQLTQQVKDHYFQLMERQAEQMNIGYTELYQQVEQFTQQLDAYPREWNTTLYRKSEELMTLCKKHCIAKPVLSTSYSVKCTKSGMLLRDMVYATNQLGMHSMQLTTWETEVVTTAPVPKPDPQPTKTGGGGTPPSPPQPIVRKMKNKMPSGKLTVSEYRQWLQQQLVLLNQFKTTDSLDFTD